jgi:hypothetical protein
VTRLSVWTRETPGRKSQIPDHFVAARSRYVGMENILASRVETRHQFYGVECKAVERHDFQSCPSGCGSHRLYHLMNFEWALQQLRDGKSVKRKAWHTPWSKLQQNIWIEKGEFYTVLRFLFSGHLSGEDLLADDWIIHEKV